MKAESSYRIVWRPLAETHLDHIIDYIAQHSPVSAQAFGQALRAKTLLLAQYPKLGRTKRPGLPAFVHELVVHSNYIVLYRVLTKARTIEILSVKHVAKKISSP